MFCAAALPVLTKRIRPARGTVGKIFPVVKTTPNILILLPLHSSWQTFATSTSVPSKTLRVLHLATHPFSLFFSCLRKRPFWRERSPCKLDATIFSRSSAPELTGKWLALTIRSSTVLSPSSYFQKNWPPAKPASDSFRKRGLLASYPIPQSSRYTTWGLMNPRKRLIW